MVDTINCWREEIHFPTEIFGLFPSAFAQVKSFELSRSLEFEHKIVNEMRSGSEEQKPAGDFKLSGSKGGASNILLPLQDEYLMSSIMDVRAAAAVHPHHHRINNNNHIGSNPSLITTQGKRIDYKRSFSQGHHGKRMIFSASYFSVESMFLLVCLTASLLLLPLILPPLPPPPFMLLMLPICILGLLMLLALMPSSNVRDATYKYL